MPLEHFDVIIVGAGLSGIGAAHHLQRDFPDRSYAILEARDTLGGTWDLFRYPGIRSDSDMHTLGYNFRPWKAEKAIADGPAILEYVRDAATEGGIDEHIRYGHYVRRAEFSTADARWTVEAERTDTGERVSLTCSFLETCSGYYRYDQGFLPDFPGMQDFHGQLIHPQHWPEDLDYSAKKVVIIGSGATAVTLVPAMAQTAAHVTMLQRSPTYIISMPSKDELALLLDRYLPDGLAYAITRWKNVGMQTISYQFSRKQPGLMKGILRRLLDRQLPAHYGVDLDTHFTPKYDPWDQRLCLVPDGDLFKALRKGKAEIVTDTIETFTETGIKLTSGAELEADIVVSATGLNLLALGGMQLAVDGTDVDLPETMAYKGMMLAGVPNFIFTVGYTNASWTLKADLTAQYMSRVLAHMDEHGHAIVVPRPDPSVRAVPFMDFQAGYVLRSLDQFPKQGDRTPWQLRQNYARDLITLRRGAVDDGALRFSSPAPVTEVAEPVAA